MPLSIGLVGMPNAGKSTVFNVLVQKNLAETASYPFSTVHPNRALIEVPDQRLTVLGELVGQDQLVRARVEFIDIAGLVEGASRGEGLGNQFLHQIRQCDALLHVVDCFTDRFRLDESFISLVDSKLNVVHQELMLSDAERLEKRIEQASREAKGDKSLIGKLHLMTQALEDLERGILLRDSTVCSHPDFSALNSDYGFITARPELVLANLSEDCIQEFSSHEDEAPILSGNNRKSIFMCARVEEELLEMPAVEREQFRRAYGLGVSVLNSVVEGCFSLLSLIRFYTIGDHEVRAWELRCGSSALEGAAKIHTDFARGFIAADVVPFKVFAEVGSERQIRSQGLMRSEGRNYQIQDGDIVRYKFNL